MNFDELLAGLRTFHWSKQALESAIRDGFKCAYCGVWFLDNYDIYRLWDNDRILPKNKYPGLMAEPLNLVSACRVCNLTKGQYDPNDDGDPIVTPTTPLSGDAGVSLIDRARDFVQAERSRKKGELRDMRQLIEQYSHA